MKKNSRSKGVCRRECCCESGEEQESRREDCRRGALRGLHSLSVSTIVGEEPGALELWRGVSGVVCDCAAWDRTFADANGVFARSRRVDDDRSEEHTSELHSRGLISYA